MSLGRKYNKIYHSLLVFLGMFAFPLISFARGLVPCGGAGEDTCGYEHVMELISNVINFIFVLVIPVTAIVFVYAGIMFIVGGTNVEARSKAKNAFIKVAIGLVLILSAWLIIATILRTLGVQDSYILLDFSQQQ